MYKLDVYVDDILKDYQYHKHLEDAKIEASLIANCELIWKLENEIHQAFHNGDKKIRFVIYLYF